jgi:hypothetical protein
METMNIASDEYLWGEESEESEAEEEAEEAEEAEELPNNWINRMIKDYHLYHYYHNLRSDCITTQNIANVDKCVEEYKSIEEQLKLLENEDSVNIQYVFQTHYDNMSIIADQLKDKISRTQKYLKLDKEKLKYKYKHEDIISKLQKSKNDKALDYFLSKTEEEEDKVSGILEQTYEPDIMKIGTKVKTLMTIEWTIKKLENHYILSEKLDELKQKQKSYKDLMLEIENTQEKMKNAEEEEQKKLSRYLSRLSFIKVDFQIKIEKGREILEDELEQEQKKLKENFTKQQIIQEIDNWKIGNPQSYIYFTMDDLKYV